MSAEDESRHITAGADETQEHAFDQLAKGFANGTMSRRRALKVLVGALLGGGLLAALPSVSAAIEQGGGGKLGEEVEDTAAITTIIIIMLTIVTPLHVAALTALSVDVGHRPVE